MSERTDLKAFVADALTDLGATVTEAAPLLWVHAPEAVQRELEVPGSFALALDPAHGGEFGAEIVAPGSYFLEKVLASAMRRGRWDVARVAIRDPEWWGPILEAAALGAPSGVGFEVLARADDLVLIFAFRVSLTADEKREAVHRIAISTEHGSVIDLGSEPADSDTVPADLPGSPPELESAYRLAVEALRARTQEDVDGFRAKSLSLLEEEVRRIFGYFDRTIEEIREADPQGAQDVVRAVMAERDRRLTEALERFDPRAAAALCSIRAVLVPTIRMRLALPDGTTPEVRVDAGTRRVRGLRCGGCGGPDGPWHPRPEGLRCARCAATRDASAPLPARPRSDTPRRGTRAAGGAGRSPRGSRARSRAASAGRRRP